MATITEDLLRKCAEHNECEIFSLEEVSLHQRNLKKIEHIDRWCRDLKILYLHNNLIPKIENLGKLKMLEYVNFTLNNITNIENLEGCESLKKLDFTANFIGELTSIETLRDNYNLEELYLTGNPCAEYEGYREYVIATLPQLLILDGEKIKKSERIIAMQKYQRIRSEILEQQNRYLRNVSFNSEDTAKCLDEANNLDALDDDVDQEFWKQPSKYTPQSRIEIYKHMEKTRKKAEGEPKKPKPARRLILDDGRVLNVNEPKIDFNFSEDEENNSYKLDLAIYRYLDTSAIDVDVQPSFVRVRIRGKYFQLPLPEEVHPDRSSTLRSQSTGHLLITMPKTKEIIKKYEDTRPLRTPTDEKMDKNQTLEVKQNIWDTIDKIVQPEKKQVQQEAPTETLQPDSQIDYFIDDPSVPPLL